jgi:hypothetical protein
VDFKGGQLATLCAEDDLTCSHGPVGRNCYCERSTCTYTRQTVNKVQSN